jgi:hypothetical protein
MRPITGERKPYENNKNSGKLQQKRRKEKKPPNKISIKSVKISKNQTIATAKQTKMSMDIDGTPLVHACNRPNTRAVHHALAALQ